MSANNAALAHTRLPPTVCDNKSSSPSRVLVAVSVACMSACLLLDVDAAAVLLASLSARVSDSVLSLVDAEAEGPGDGGDGWDVLGPGAAVAATVAEVLGVGVGVDEGASLSPKGLAGAGVGEKGSEDASSPPPRALHCASKSS